MFKINDTKYVAFELTKPLGKNAKEEALKSYYDIKSEIIKNENGINSGLLNNETLNALNHLKAFVNEIRQNGFEIYHREKYHSYAYIDEDCVIDVFNYNSRQPISKTLTVTFYTDSKNLPVSEKEISDLSSLFELKGKGDYLKMFLPEALKGFEIESVYIVDENKKRLDNTLDFQLQAAKEDDISFISQKDITAEIAV